MFEKYKVKIEASLQQEIVNMGPPSRLLEACQYALFSGGKRLRPILVLMIAEALGNGLDVMPAALSVEFFHTASLIADDLPCMDDDDERRLRPTLHRVFEESVALLASYTFIASGYEGISKNYLKMKKDPHYGKFAESSLREALAISTRCAGIQGATNGQFLDLFPPNNQWETIEKIIEQKTITLFQISFVFGWLFGGGEEKRLAEVKQSAYHLGMAFQIADDIQDMQQDALHEGSLNVACVMGVEKATALFEEEAKKWQKSLERLGLWNEEFEMAKTFLHSLKSKEAVKPLCEQFF